MQGPLGAAPRFAGVDGATVIIEYTVAIHSLHLNGITALPPIFSDNFLPFHAKMLDHSFLVVFVK